MREAETDLFADAINSNDLSGVNVTINGRRMPLSLAVELCLTADLDVPAPAPRRADYRAVLATIAKLDDREQVIGCLAGLWHDYGWSALVDLMAHWVIQIHQHPNIGPKDRTPFGGVDITRIVVMDNDEATVLRLAATNQAQFEEEGVPPHEAFAASLALVENNTRLAQLWRPYINAAFASALRDGNWTDAAASLARAPHRDDQHSLMQIALLMGTAAMGVRHRDQIMRHHAEAHHGHHRHHDDMLIDSGHVNPRWTAGYKAPR